MTDPTLGPKQAALVDAVTTRLWSGTPLNRCDLAAVAWLGEVLDMAPFVRPARGYRSTNDGTA